jgi:hypothetical protein
MPHYTLTLTGRMAAAATVALLAVGFVLGRFL